MTPNWSAYSPYRPPYWGPLRTLTRAQAKESFDKWLDARDERRAQMSALMHGPGAELGDSDEDIQAVNDWFLANIETSPEDATRPSNRWYAVVNDVASYLGSVIVSRNPQLRWEFNTQRKSDPSYQKHVIAGFTKIPNRRYVVDIDGLIATYTHRAVGGAAVPTDHFRALVSSADADA